MIKTSKDSIPAFHLRLPATALSTRTARQTVRDFAAGVGIGGDRLDEVELAVAEACANAVVHGLPDGDATFEVTGSLCGDAMIIRTIDAGAGIDGARDSEGLGLGLGIPLIAALADDVSFGTPAEGGTEVRMTFLVCPSGRRRVRDVVRTKDRRAHSPPAGV